MSDEDQHVALPKLYGAPAYARPVTGPAEPVPRPFDPDQLPLEVFQSEDDRRFAEHLPAHTYVGTAASQAEPAPGRSRGGLRARRFNLRAIAGRLLGGG